MWGYIAGLFDGEGNFAIAKHLYKNQTPTIEIRGVITSGEKNQFSPIVIFLKENGIFMGSSKANEDTYHFYIGSHNGLKKFCEMIYPYLIFKKKTCEIIMEALRLKEEIKEKGEFIKDNFFLFDQLRHDLHKYARKGPKDLKPWK